MTPFQSGLQNIVEGQGVPIAIVGMVVVFIALGFITSFIALLPHILRRVALIVPERALPAPRALGDADEALAAAAAAAYHAARTRRS